MADARDDATGGGTATLELRSSERVGLGLSDVGGAATLDLGGSHAASPTLAPRGVPERFRTEAELGRGGMGRVIGAHDRQLGRAVAIKVMLDPDNAASLVRFEREIKVTARLQHPSIVPIYDAGYDTDGRPYYVMRRVEGRRLDAHVADAGDLRDRLTLIPALLAAADAIAYAHARHIVHRDLKPANIMLGEHGETFVIDWGIAKNVDDPEDKDADGATDAGLTGHGAVLGTPGYMAPEQTAGQAVDERADVYALGATLYHILEGRRPRADRAVSRAVPIELAAIVDKAMALDPEKRYRDASGFASDVRRFMTGQLVAAHRYRIGERLRRFVRRNLVAVVLAAVLGTALLVIGATSLSLIVDARDRARDGWHHAEERAEVASLARAETLIETDPTAAAVIALELRTESTRWNRARGLVSIARANGIARALATTGPRIARLGVDAGQTRLLALDLDGLAIQDLDGTHTRRVLSTPGLHGAIWLDGNRIAVADADGTFVLDVVAGDRRELARGGPSVLAASADGRVLAWRDRDGTHIGSGSTPLHLGGAMHPGQIEVSPDGRWIATWGPKETLRLVRPDGTPLAVLLALDAEQLAFRADGARLAVVRRSQELVELESQDGEWRVARSWTLGWPTGSVGYAGDTLLGWSPNGDVFAFVGPTPFRLGDLKGGVRSVARLPDALAFAVNTEVVTIFDRKGATAVRSPVGLVHRVVASSRQVLCGASVDGSIVVWRLDDVRPSKISVGQAGFVAAVAADVVLACEPASCAFVRRDGTRTPISPLRPGVMSALTLPDGVVLLKHVDHRVTAARIADGVTVTLDAPTAVAAGGEVVALYGRSLELRRPFGPQPGRTLTSFDSDVIAIATAGHVVAAALADRTLWRMDLRTGATRTRRIDASLESNLIVADDAVLVGSGSSILRWIGDDVETIVTFRAPVVSIAYAPEIGVTALTADHVVHHVIESGSRSTNVWAHTRLAPGGLALADGTDRGTAVVDIAAGTVRYLPRRGLASVSPRGDAIAVHRDGTVELHKNDLPRDVVALRRWLAHATNAELDPQHAVIRWRDVPPAR